MQRLFLTVPVVVLFALAFAEVSDGGGPGSAAERDAAVARMQRLHQQQVHGSTLVDPHEARFDQLPAAYAPLEHTDADCAAGHAGPSEDETLVAARALVTRAWRTTDFLMTPD